MSVKRLRFTEFNESYEKFVSLSNFIEHISDRNKNNKVNNVLSVSNKLGFINQSQQFEDRIVASKNLSNYKIVHKYDFAFNPARINVGSIARLERFDSGIVSPMYIVFRTNDKLNSEFLKYFLDTKIFNDQLTKFLVGSVRQTLDFKSLLKIKIRNKGHEEQVKIGNFLSLFDRLIEKLETKMGLLKELKKGYLQQMFPAKGEKVPKIRFAGFNEDWETVEINKLLTDESIKSKINNQHEIISSTKKGLFKQSDYFDKQIASTINIGYKILKYGRFVMSPQNAWMGNTNVNIDYEIGIVSPSYKIYRIDQKQLSILYFRNLIKTNKFSKMIKGISEMGASIVRRNLDINSFEELRINIAGIKEQEKIGNFLKNLDSMIEKQEKELNTIEQLKKGYMQRLFA